MFKFSEGHTPISDDRFWFLQLRRSMGETSNVGSLEGSRDFSSHDEAAVVWSFSLLPDQGDAIASGERNGIRSKT